MNEFWNIIISIIFGFLLGTWCFYKKLKNDLIKSHVDELLKIRKDYEENLNDAKWDQMLLDAISEYEKELNQKYGSINGMSKADFDLETAHATLETVYIFRDNRIPKLRPSMARLFSIVTIKYMQMEQARIAADMTQPEITQNKNSLN